MKTRPVDMEDLEPKSEIKKKAEVKQPRQYTVKVECFIPATLVFQITAENEEEAIKQTHKQAPNQVQQKIAKRKNIKATVYDRNTINVKLVKHLR